MTITTINNFYFYFPVTEKKTFYIITNKEGKKIRINKREMILGSKNLILSEILNSLSFILENKIKQEATKKDKENFSRLQLTATRLQKFLKVQDYSYKSLLKEAICNKNF